MDLRTLSQAAAGFAAHARRAESRRLGVSTERQIADLALWSAGQEDGLTELGTLADQLLEDPDILGTGKGSAVAQTMLTADGKEITIGDLSGYTGRDGALQLAVVLGHEAFRDGIVGSKTEQQQETIRDVLGHSARWLAERSLWWSKEGLELINGELGSTDKTSQSADGKLLVLRHREIGSTPRPTEHNMTADLPQDVPPSFLKGLDGLHAGDVCKTSHGLDSNNHLMLSVGQGLRGCDLLILGPEPGLNGFLDVGQGLLLVLALGNATRESRTLRDYPAIFCVVYGDVKQHQ